MPMRMIKKLAYKKRAYKKRRAVNVLTGRGKYRGSIAGKVHLFKRLGHVATIQNTAVGGAINLVDPQSTLNAPTPGLVLSPDTYGFQFPVTMAFSLNKSIDNNDLTALYDRYKIKGIRIKITPLQNVSTSGGTGILPMICYTTDWDDVSTPASYEDVARKGYAKTRTLNRPISLYIKPKVAGEVYRSGITSAYSVLKAPWLDCNNIDVPHYGLKMWFRNVQLPSNATGALQCFRFETTYYLALKDTQ